MEVGERQRLAGGRVAPTGEVVRVDGRVQHQRQHHDAAEREMVHGALAHLEVLLAGVGGVLERHGDEEAAHLVHAGQQRAGEDLVILAHPADEVGQDDPVHQTVGVVGNDDEGALSRDPGDLCGRREHVDAHHRQRLGPEGLPLGHALALELPDEAQERQLARQPLERADRCRLGGAVEGRGIGKLALVVGNVVAIGRGDAAVAVNHAHPAGAAASRHNHGGQRCAAVPA